MRRRTFLGTALAALLSRDARSSTALVPTAVVVGAGPAGISAALELASKGVSVVLVEAGSDVGGKANGWREALAGEEVDVEHGIHGWWYQYVHFRDLLRRHKLIQNLTPSSAGMNVRGEGVSSKFMARANQFIARSKEKGFKNFPFQYNKGMRWLHKSTPASLRAELGGKSITEWLRRKPPLTVYTVFDEPMCYSMYFRGPDEIDAAEYMEGERFYFSGTKHNGEVDWLRGNPDQLVWKPLADAFVGYGGELRRNTTVHSLLMEKNRVVGVRTGASSAEVIVEGLFQEWTEHELAGQKIWVGPGKELPVAFSARCTHQGCAVLAAGEGFVCPCHGGRYDNNGSPTAGPPQHPLTRLNVEPVHGKKNTYRVTQPTSKRLIPAKWVILAVDVPVLKELVGERLPQVEGLSATREVVARFWFDRDVSEESLDSLLLDRYTYSCNAFLVHRIQDRSRDWAAAKKGSVIEIQSFHGWTGDETEAQMLSAIEKEVREIWPELEEAKVLKSHLTVGSGFTFFTPGWREHALRVQPGIDGLLIAGDHVDVPDREEQFMERAVMTGRMAANVVLRAEGLAPAPILSPRSK